MSKFLGPEGSVLADYPLGKSISRVAEAVAGYVDGEQHTPVGDELADSAVNLADMVLDLLEELQILDPVQE